MAARSYHLQPGASLAKTIARVESDRNGINNIDTTESNINNGNFSLRLRDRSGSGSRSNRSLMKQQQNQQYGGPVGQGFNGNSNSSNLNSVTSIIQNLNTPRFLQKNTNNTSNSNKMSTPNQSRTAVGPGSSVKSQSRQGTPRNQQLSWQQERDALLSYIEDLRKKQSEMEKAAAATESDNKNSNTNVKLSNLSNMNIDNDKASHEFDTASSMRAKFDTLEQEKHLMQEVYRDREQQLEESLSRSQSQVQDLQKKIETTKRGYDSQIKKLQDEKDSIMKKQALIIQRLSDSDTLISQQTSRIEKDHFTLKQVEEQLSSSKITIKELQQKIQNQTSSMTTHDHSQILEKENKLLQEQVRALTTLCEKFRNESISLRDAATNWSTVRNDQASNNERSLKQRELAMLKIIKDSNCIDTSSSELTNLKYSSSDDDNSKIDLVSLVQQLVRQASDSNKLNQVPKLYNAESKITASTKDTITPNFNSEITKEFEFFSHGVQESEPSMKVQQVQESKFQNLPTMPFSTGTSGLDLFPTEPPVPQPFESSENQFSSNQILEPDDLNHNQNQNQMNHSLDPGRPPLMPQSAQSQTRNNLISQQQYSQSQSQSMNNQFPDLSDVIGLHGRMSPARAKMGLDQTNYSEPVSHQYRQLASSEINLQQLSMSNNKESANTINQIEPLSSYFGITNASKQSENLTPRVNQDTIENARIRGNTGPPSLNINHTLQQNQTNQYPHHSRTSSFGNNSNINFDPTPINHTITDTGVGSLNLSGFSNTQIPNLNSYLQNYSDGNESAQASQLKARIAAVRQQFSMMRLKVLNTSGQKS